jgi:hypothetical protein
VLTSRGSPGEACRHAMFAAASLASHRPVEPSLLESSFLSTLVTYADHEDRRTRTDAMRTVSFLCMEAPRLLPRGSSDRMSLLSVVVRCGMSTETLLQELALLVLGLWSEDLSLHSELVYAGALAPLVLALNAPWEPPAPAPKGHLYGSRALACIAIHSTYRSLIVEANALPPLLRHIGSTDGGVRLSACRTVCALSSDVAGALAILRADGLGTLLTVESGHHKRGGSSAHTPVKGMRSPSSLLPATLRESPHGSPASRARAGLGDEDEDDDDEDEDAWLLRLPPSPDRSSHLPAAAAKEEGGAKAPAEDTTEAAVAAATEAKSYQLPRGALEQEYASKAVANCYAAWRLEAASFEAEEQRFGLLQSALHVGSVSDLETLTAAMEAPPTSPYGTPPPLGPGRTAGDVPDSPRSLEARLGSVAKTRPPPDGRGMAGGLATPAAAASGKAQARPPPSSLPRAPPPPPSASSSKLAGAPAGAGAVGTGAGAGLVTHAGPRSSTSFRVLRPDLVRLSAVFVGWRYLCAIRAHEAALREMDGAAKVLQGANRRHQRKRQAKGATRIQAGFRGKRARARRGTGGANEEQKAALGSVARTSVLGSAIRDDESALVNADADGQDGSPPASPATPGWTPGVVASTGTGGEGGGMSELDEAAAKIQAVFKGKQERSTPRKAKSAAEKQAERDAHERVRSRAEFVEASARHSESRQVTMRRAPTTKL